MTYAKVHVVVSYHLFLSQKKSEMDFTTSPRNVHAQRASLRLYEDSQMRNERKQMRAKERDLATKSNCEQFRASKTSELILRRASFRPSPADLAPTVDSLLGKEIERNVDCLEDSNSDILSILNVAEPDVKKTLVVETVVSSATASTRASPRGSNLKVMSGIGFTHVTVPVMDWSGLFDSIYYFSS